MRNHTCSENIYTAKEIRSFTICEKDDPATKWCGARKDEVEKEKNDVFDSAGNIIKAAEKHFRNTKFNGAYRLYIQDKM